VKSTRLQPHSMLIAASIYQATHQSCPSAVLCLYPISFNTLPSAWAPEHNYY